MKSIKRSLAVLFLLSTVFLSGCGEDSSIALVKNSSFHGYESTTIGKLLDNTFSKTKWTVSENSKGEVIVLFNGQISQSMHDSLKQKILNAGFDYQHPNANEVNVIINVVDQVFSGAIGGGHERVNELVKECRQYYSLLDSMNTYSAQKKSYEKDLERYRREGSYAISNAEGIIADLEKKITYLRGELPANDPQCLQNIRAESEKAIDELYWVAGDTVFFEWKIHSNRKTFTISRFGGKSIGRRNLDSALEIIYGASN